VYVVAAASAVTTEAARTTSQTEWKRVTVVELSAAGVVPGGPVTKLVCHPGALYAESTVGRTHHSLASSAQPPQKAFPLQP